MRADEAEKAAQRGRPKHIVHNNKKKIVVKLAKYHLLKIHLVKS